MQNLYNTLLIICTLALFTACGKDDETTTPDYNIPTFYDFDNVNYSGQEQRIAMLTELSAYMKSANVANTALDADRLQAMFANDASLANWMGNYETSKQMKDKTFPSVQADFEQLLSDLAIASQSTVAAESGIAGIATSSDGNKNYLLNANGVELGQIITKGLMGALLYYQATAVYFGADKMNVDNTTITPGEGTEMEHHWDEAFGYFGVPKTFPSNTEPLYFWGDYSHKRNDLLKTNQALMNALIKGRAAISNKDLTSRDEAISEARTAWEKIAVGSALHYLNSTLADFDDMAIRAHRLSEAAGFIYALQFNPDKKIDNNQVASLLNEIGGSTQLDQLNFYNTTIEAITSVRDQLATAYAMEDLKLNL